LPFREGAGLVEKTSWKRRPGPRISYVGLVVIVSMHTHPLR
jgi:hypothetical protein